MAATRAHRCDTCSGFGTVTIADCMAAFGEGRFNEQPCPDCDGAGEVEDEAPLCLTCDGPLDANGWCQSCDEFAAVPAELLPENRDRWVA